MADGMILMLSTLEVMIPALITGVRKVDEISRDIGNCECIDER